jgi:hypothetical protein
MTLHRLVFFKILRFQFFFVALRFRVLQVGLSDGSEEDGITQTRRGWHSLSWGGGGGSRRRRRREGKRERRRSHYLASQQSCRIMIRY